MSRWIIEDMNSVRESCPIHETAMYWKGDWYCSECQEKEYYLELEDAAGWYSQSRLCQQCANCNGPDWGDQCEHYKMPLYMVKRKRKCKHFKEIDWKMEG